MQFKKKVEFLKSKSQSSHLFHDFPYQKNNEKPNVSDFFFGMTPHLGSDRTISDGDITWKDEIGVVGLANVKNNIYPTTGRQQYG